MKKTWKPIAAGILEIIAFCWIVVSALYFLSLSILEAPRPWWDSDLGLWIWWMIPFFAFLLGIVALVGGVFALLRRRWGLAFSGAIATVPLIFIAPFGGRVLANYINIDLTIVILRLYQVLPLLLSVAIITLLILSKREFK